MLRLSGGTNTQTAQRVKQPGLAEPFVPKFSWSWEFLGYTEAEAEWKTGAVELSSLLRGDGE